MQATVPKVFGSSGGGTTTEIKKRHDKEGGPKMITNKKSKLKKLANQEKKTRRREKGWGVTKLEETIFKNQPDREKYRNSDLKIPECGFQMGCLNSPEKGEKRG